MTSRTEVPGQPFEYEAAFDTTLDALDDRVRGLRDQGRLDGAALSQLSKFFRVRTIFNSNAIEGNQLSEGETRLVVEQGLTIAGKSLRDHLETQNLAHALDFFEELASRRDPIMETDIRQVHAAILKGINDEGAGVYRTSEVMITGSEFPPTAPEAVAAEMRDLGGWIHKASVGSIISTRGA